MCISVDGSCVKSAFGVEFEKYSAEVSFDSVNGNVEGRGYFGV